jgi:nitrite reductase/ring-hydroxylating ferredoxin subunit
MTENNPSDSLVRYPVLVVAAVYERVIEASLERVWENVYDWEHLPYLHSEAFTGITLVDSGSWGWRAKVGMPGGQEGKIELIADRPARHYVARTLEGAGASNETWTSLDPISEYRTGIRVEFCSRPTEADALRQFGKGMIGLYTLLWDQDEGMMQGRTQALASREEARAARKGQPQSGPTVSIETVALGSIEVFRSRLPFVFEVDGRSYCVTELEGEFVAFPTECPHLLGPLADCAVKDGVIACPWHGYEFDVRSGKSTDGRSLRLRSAPRIEIDEVADRVYARFGSEEAYGSP